MIVVLILGKLQIVVQNFINNDSSTPCLTKDNSYDDTGSNNCYDYGGRRFVLAGKQTFIVREFETFQISF